MCAQQWPGAGGKGLQAWGSEAEGLELHHAPGLRYEVKHHLSPRHGPEPEHLVAPMPPQP